MISKKLKLIFQSPWFLALILLGVFCITTSYKYGWDDQHLEVPLLKGLIDSTLYPADYYVQSLKKNFPSYFYHILSKIITVEQVPTVYFILYFLSRYFLFYWIYRLWLLISQNRFHAFVCVLVFLLMVRVEEFLYRTFSHQEFTYPIIFAGIYYFFKGKFVRAGALFGIAANFHALYTLFPMSYLGVYLLWQIRTHGLMTLIKTVGAYLISALPFIIWIFQNRLGVNKEVADPDWIATYITACPQNFFFPRFPIIPWEKLISNINVIYYAFQDYLVLLVAFFANLFLSDKFRMNKKAIAYCVTGFAFLAGCFVFTYLYPNRLALDLNLTRNTQFLSILLMGFMALLFIDKIEKERLTLAFLFSVLFVFIKYSYPIATCSMLIAIGVVLIQYLLARLSTPWIKYTLAALITVLIILPASVGIAYYFNIEPFRDFIRRNLAIIFVSLTLYYFFCLLTKNAADKLAYRRLFLLIPLTVFLYQYGSYHYEKLQIEKNGGGFWQIQRSWEDMQRYIQKNTPKDAVILIPYNTEMCGFRIQAERTIVVSLRDYGIVGFDYSAALEWKRRVADVQAFKLIMTEPPVSAIKNAVVKYDASYIMFPSYSAPPKDNGVLQRVYENMDFVLFRVFTSYN